MQWTAWNPATRDLLSPCAAFGLVVYAVFAFGVDGISKRSAWIDSHDSVSCWRGGTHRRITAGPIVAFGLMKFFSSALTEPQWDRFAIKIT